MKTHGMKIYGKEAIKMGAITRQALRHAMRAAKEIRLSGSSTR